MTRFAGQTEPHCNPEPEDVKGFEAFLEEYKKLLPAGEVKCCGKIIFQMQNYTGSTTLIYRKSCRM